MVNIFYHFTPPGKDFYSNGLKLTYLFRINHAFRNLTNPSTIMLSGAKRCLINVELENIEGKFIILRHKVPPMTNRKDRADAAIFFLKHN